MPTKSTSGPIEAHPSMRTHPGEVLELMIKEGLRTSISDAARQIGVSRQALHNIIIGKAGVTPDMAIKLGEIVGSARLWLNLQSSYDLAKAEERRSGQAANQGSIVND